MPQPHPALIAFAREFNAGRHFEAHESLEESLDVLPEDRWDLFVGLIQIAVDYHKRAQGLRRGSMAMLGRGLEKIRAFPDDAVGLNLAALRSRVSADLQHTGRPTDTVDPEPRDTQPRIRFLHPSRPGKKDRF